MTAFLKSFIYRSFIDPLLSGVRSAIFDLTDHASRVIDVACGTGSLAFTLAEKADRVTGIDIDEDIISSAQGRAERKGLNNKVMFELKDASDLSGYGDGIFDIAVTSMSVHQFDTEVAVKVLREMKRVSAKIIIADYNCPRPAGLSGLLAYSIERMAKGDHYRNYSNYMARGGLSYFTEMAGLSVLSKDIRSNGVFIIAVCK